MQRLLDSCRIKKFPFKAFPLFLGLFLGFSLFQTRKLYFVFLLLFLIPFIYLKWKRKEKATAHSFVLGLSVGLLIAALFRFLPLLEGEQKLFGIVIEAKDNYFIFFSKGRRFYVPSASSNFEEGDLLEIVGNVEPLSFSHQEGRFNFRDYLLNKGVKQEFDIDRINTVFLRPLRLREMERRFLSMYSKETSALLDAFLFSKKDYSSNVLTLAKDLKIIAIFGSSGIYFGLFRRYLTHLFSYFVDKDKQTALSFIILSFFFPFSFFKIGIARIYLSMAFDVYCLLRKKELFSYLQKIGFLGIFFFALNPFTFREEAFLISFGFSFFLYIVRYRVNSFEKKRTRKIVSFGWSFLFLLPLFINGSSFGLLSPFASFLFPPILFPYIVSGYFSFFFHTPFYFLEGYTNFLNSLLSSLASLPLSISLYRIDSWFKDAYYSLLFLSLYLSEEGFNFIKERILGFSFLLYLLSLLPSTHYFNYEVCFLDVGQGDSILIRVQNKAVLVDTGGDYRFDMAKEVLIPYLRKEGIYRLDALIITHPDFDHDGAKESLLENYRVLSLKEKKEDFPYRIGPLTIRNLNEVEGTETNKNIGSLVLAFKIDGIRFLLMGDAPKEIEEEITRREEIGCDVLKVGHHGSKSSSCSSFLAKANPKEAVISCGTKNKFGHPDKEVIKRMEEKKIKIRRTDLEGTIVYKGFIQEGFSFF